MPDPGSLKEYGLSGGPTKRRHRRPVVKSVLCMPSSEHASNTTRPQRELPVSKPSSVLQEKNSDGLRQGSRRERRALSWSVLEPPDSNRASTKPSVLALSSFASLSAESSSTYDSGPTLMTPDDTVICPGASCRDTANNPDPSAKSKVSVQSELSKKSSKNSKRTTSASFLEPQSPPKRSKTRASCPAVSRGVPKGTFLIDAEIARKEPRGNVEQESLKRNEALPRPPTDGLRFPEEGVSTGLDNTHEESSHSGKLSFGKSRAKRSVVALPGCRAAESHSSSRTLGKMLGTEPAVCQKKVVEDEWRAVGVLTARCGKGCGKGNEKEAASLEPHENATVEVIRKSVSRDSRRQRKTVTFADGATEIPNMFVRTKQSVDSLKDDELVGNTVKDVGHGKKMTSPKRKRNCRTMALVERVKRGEKGLTVLMDDLQYSLDCLFPHGSKAQHEAAQVMALGKILKMFCPETDAKHTLEPAVREERSKSILLEVLRRRPDQLRMLVTALLEIRRRPAPIPVLAMAVLTIIADGVKICEGFTKENIEPLVEAFYGSCYANKPDLCDEEGENGNGGVRGRGRMGRIVSSMHDLTDEAREDVCKSLNGNGLLSTHGLSLKLFEDVTQIASLLAGVVLSKILAESDEARDAMNMQNRLGRISAVLYRTLGNLKELDETNRGVLTLVQKEKDKRLALLGITMVVFYEASHEEQVKRKIVEQSSVTRRSIQYLIYVVRKGHLHHQTFECFRIHALRLLINIVHGYDKGLNQFVQQGGVQVVLDCLASSMGMTRSNKRSSFSERNFDVAVLCLALLVSVADASACVRKLLQDVEPTLTVSREHGGVAFVLELLKVTWDNVDEGDTGGTSSGAKQMERKVITGYLCLLLGALVRQNRKNRTVIRNALPGRTLSGLLPVIDDFLDFHHSAGVNQHDLNTMYKRIMDGLHVEEGLATSEEGDSNL